MTETFRDPHIVHLSRALRPAAYVAPPNHPLALRVKLSSALMLLGLVLPLQFVV